MLLLERSHAFFHIERVHNLERVDPFQNQILVTNMLAFLSCWIVNRFEVICVANELFFSGTRVWGLTKFMSLHTYVCEVNILYVYLHIVCIYSYYVSKDYIHLNKTWASFAPGSVTATGRRAQATSTEVNLQPVEKVKNLIKAKSPPATGEISVKVWPPKWKEIRKKVWKSEICQILLETYKDGFLEVVVGEGSEGWTSLVIRRKMKSSCSQRPHALFAARHDSSVATLSCWPTWEMWFEILQYSAMCQLNDSAFCPSLLLLSAMKTRGTDTYPPWYKHHTWKCMVGRRSFPLGWPIFRGGVCC